MNRLFAALLGTAACMAVFASPAFANDPPAPQTFIANITLTPIILAVFVLSGAAALYDARNKKRGGRWISLLVFTILNIISGLNESLGLALAIVLCAYGIIVAVRMLRVSKDAQTPRRKAVIRGAAILLIPLCLFLGSFSFAFNSMTNYLDYSKAWKLGSFRKSQEEYAAKHEGRFKPVYPNEDSEYPLKDFYRMNNGNKSCVEITYGDDMRSYSVTITPTMFLPIPYRWLTSRTAFFMDESGIIRSKRLLNPGPSATAESPPHPDQRR
jgi:hypothetical protein